MTVRFVVGLLSLMLLGQCHLAQSLMGQDELQQQFAKIIDRAGKRNFSGIVVAEKDGTILANQSFGYADSKSKTPIDSKTLFEIGSVTKPVTALAIIILERQGKLSLDDSIADHLPNVSEDCRSITIQHLLQHTSGIPGTNYGPVSKDVAEVTHAYLRGGPKQTPGTNFEYWNQGYALLAAIIAEVTDQSYQDAIRDLVLRPAKMNSTCFTGDSAPQGFDVAIGRSTSGADRSALEHPYGDFYGLQYQGMGGVVSNAEDMTAFLQAFRKSKTSVERMLQPGPDGSYGLGWRIENADEINQRAYHTGSVRGFLTAVSIYPEQNSSLIVLANTDDRQSFHLAESGCRKAFEAAVVPRPTPQQFDTEFQESLVGQFTLQSRVVTISSSDDGLEMVIDWGGPKTYGKLAKTSSANRLRYLDGSKDEVFVLLEGQKNKKVQSLQILNSTYLRRK
ncbi:serine hydrolase domain-containing protein [Rhodopirellula bahusiensis]|nr:serine hydrolase domain-containing protein [Rhodopirellula bahusiensis]